MAPGAPRPPDETDPAPLSKDRESRFGTLAVSLGLLKPEDLRSAVEEQKAAGARARLGEILVKRGFLKMEDALRVLELQDKKIFACPNCLRKYNVANLDPGASLHCRFCNATVVLRETGDDLGADESFYAPEPRATAPPPSKLTPEMVDLIPGYRIERVLGQGGMGTVYLATQLSLSRQVAIKVLSPELSRDAAYVKRFLDEARAIAGLQHDNIVRAIDRGEAEGRYYLVMEYAEGDTLAKRLLRTKTVPEREAVVLARQIAEGLRYALTLHFIHRDIKPANVIVSREGRVRICDLGLTRSAASVESDVPKGHVLITPAYASPEAVRGEDLDCRTDIYSLGVTLYEMLTGARPFVARDPQVVSRQQLTETPKPPRQVNPAISEGMQRLVLRMLAKDPSGRPSEYDALIRDLDSLVGARPPTEAQTARRKGPVAKSGAKRIPIGPIIGAGVGLVALVAIINMIGGGDPEKKRTEKKEERREEPTETTRTPEPEPKEKAAVKKTDPEPEPKTDPAPDPKMATQEFRRKLNLYIWKLNLSGIAAAYCDRMSMAKQAVELRENMARLEAEMSAFLEDLKRRGESPYVDDWIRPKDDILWFDRCELAKVSREEGARVLGTFVAGVKAGSRARVVVKRGGDTAEFNILFDERPKDLLAISQVASIIPSGGNGGGTEVVPVQKTEKNFFADPKEWGKESARRQVLDEWRVVNSEFARGLVLFLEVPDVEVDDAQRAVLAKHFEKFNPYKVRGVDEHASAAKSLFEAMKPLKSKRAAESVALGHLGEACRDGVTPGKAAAEAGGLSLSTDRRVWGSGEDLLLYNLLVAPADAERAAGSGSFRMSYLGTYLMLKKTLEAGKGYRTLHALLLATAKKGDDRAKRHLEALADEVRMAAKCGACTNGKVDCPECGGKGSVSVSKCATCGGTGREGGAGSSFNITCRTCKDKEPLKSGGLKDCPKCTKFDHRVKCPACKGEEWLSSLQAAPRIMTTSLCRPCAGSGHVFRRVARVCERCAGVGVIVAPASKPRALLRD